MNKMADYKVISPFRDKYTKKHYGKGDIYSHKQSERITDLTKRGFIEEVSGKEIDQNGQEQQQQEEKMDTAEKDSEEFPKHTGGGWFELSNGEKVQGKEEAEKAEADLN
jgi:uncharacterized protein YwgA